MGLLSVILSEYLSGNQCGYLILSQVNCLSVQEKSSRDVLQEKLGPAIGKDRGVLQLKAISQHLK